MSKILTNKIAEQFLTDPEEVELDEFTSIEDEAAKLLSKFKGDLELFEITKLSDAAAESLSKHKGKINDMDPKERVESFEGVSHD